MISSFITDYSLRGYTFEYAAKILLRRQTKNNFIFQTNQFDNIQEVIKKYRLTIPDIFSHLETLYQNFKFTSCDLISFTLNNTKDRIVKSITFFEIKTKSKMFTKITSNYVNQISIF